MIRVKLLKKKERKICISFDKTFIHSSMHTIICREWSLIMHILLFYNIRIMYTFT